MKKFIKKVLRIKRFDDDRNLGYWEHKAKTDPYASIYTGWSKKNIYNLKLSIIFRPDIILNKKMVILDLCGAVGRVANFIHKDVKKYILVDFSKTMIALAKKEYKDISNIEYLVNDGVSIKEIPNNSIDLIFCEFAFQHMAKEITEKYVQDVHRALKKGGVFLAQIPRLDYYQDVYAFTEKESCEMFYKYQSFSLDYSPDNLYYIVKALK